MYKIEGLINVFWSFENRVGDLTYGLGVLILFFKNKY